jgi:hypothetical protein
MKIGDTVTRMLAGVIPMQLVVTEITSERIICGAWEFDKKTGHEIDDEIGDGHHIVSYLVMQKGEKYQCLDCLQQFFTKSHCKDHASKNHLYMPNTPFDKPRFIVIGGDGKVFLPEELP